MKRNLFVLTLAFLCLFTSKAETRIRHSRHRGREKQTYSIGIKMPFMFWEIEKNNYILTDTKFISEGGYGPIEKIKAQPNLSVGPELKFYHGSFFTRGYYTIGKYSFDVGDATRHDIGVDAGIEYTAEKFRIGIFLGWRKMKTEFSDWSSNNIDGENISDAILGFHLRKPNDYGFVANMEGALGFHILSEYEHANIGEFEFIAGYRFENHMNISVGYGVQYYYGPTAGVVERFNPFYNKIISSIEGQRNLSHGPVITANYIF